MTHHSIDQIETARLRLRKPQSSDAEAIFTRYASDPMVTRYLGWPRHRTLTDTHEFLSFSASQWEKWPAGPFLIEDLASGRLLGSTGLDFTDRLRASTGYVLAQDSWGQGYASEALRAILDLSTQHQLEYLYALCHAVHIASRRVLERCGFSLEEGEGQRFPFPNLDPSAAQIACRYSVDPTRRSDP